MKIFFQYNKSITINTGGTSNEYSSNSYFITVESSVGGNHNLVTQSNDNRSDNSNKKDTFICKNESYGNDGNNDIIIKMNITKKTKTTPTTTLAATTTTTTQFQM